MVREVDTDAGAELVGSAKIRIDGANIEDPDAEPPALTCRVYHRRDGRISPVPDPVDVRDALHNTRRRGALHEHRRRYRRPTFTLPDTDDAMRAPGVPRRLAHALPACATKAWGSHVRSTPRRRPTAS
jgi:hypothetical protein